MSVRWYRHVRGNIRVVIDEESHITVDHARQLHHELGKALDEIDKADATNQEKP